MDKRFKQIALASFLLSGLGLIIELSHFLVLGPAWEAIHGYVSFLGYYVYLEISPELSWYRYNNPITHYSVNLLHVGFYLVMLSGALFYYFSQQRETRLIRFSFAVILMVQLVGQLSAALAVSVYFEEYYIKQPVNFLWLIAGSVKDIAVIILSIWVLKEIRKTKTLSFSPNEAGENVLHATSRWERLFHHILDNLLCFLIFGYVHYLLTNQIGPLRSMQRELGWMGSLMVFLILYRLIYYVVSEAILSASPAKLLTESRVVTFEGKNIELHNAITRAAIRFVPFEPFSFFGKSGWHDQWSSTDVVKENRTGVVGGLYFIILPALLLLGVGGYFGIEWYDDHRQYVAEKEIYDAQVKEYSYELDHLTTRHFIELQDANDPYAGGKTFIKINSIYNGKANVSVFSGNDESPIGVVENYYADTGAVEKQTIDIEKLKKALATDFDDVKKGVVEGETVLEGTKRYWVDNVFIEGAPVLKTNSSGYHMGRGYDFEFENCGWPVMLVEIRIIHGDIRFENKLPYKIPGKVSGEYGCGSFSLQGVHENFNVHYVIELVVRDVHGRDITYVVEGTGLTRTMKRKL